MFSGGSITLAHYLTIHPTDIAFQIAKDLEFTTSRSLAGRHGDVAGININRNPDWATNLNNLLTLFDLHNLKLVLHEMGTPWATSLGILAPYYNYQPVSIWGATATPISEGLELIDKLAGNNSLGHNFFTDRRMPYFQVINEANYDIPEVRTWTAAIADRIRSYGGKVTGSLRTTNNRYAQAFPEIMPFAEEHFDYLQAHEYIYYVVTSDIRNRGASAEVYQPVYDRGIQMFGQMIADKGPFSASQVILGEWGFWHGTMQGPGLSYPLTVTLHQQAEYIRAVFDALKDVGLRNQYYHLIFNNPTETWGIVDGNGVPYEEVYESFKTGMSNLNPYIPPIIKKIPWWLVIPAGLVAYLISRE